MVARPEHSTVLLVIPPGEPGTTPNHEGSAGLGAVTVGEGGFRYAPQMMATIAQELVRQGNTVATLDAPAFGLSLDDALTAIRQADPALVCAQVSWATRESDRLFLRRLGRTQSLAVGPSTRFMLDCLEDATWVLQGDPVGCAASVTASILAGEDLQHLIEPSAMSQDEPPVAAWDLWPIGRYTHISMSTSQGCDAACLWCPYIVAQGQAFRPRPAEHVVAEMEALVQRHRPARIIVRDPAFACDTARAKRICRLILKSSDLAHGRAVAWECESRPEHFDGELIRLLSLAGCIGVKVGLESIDPQFLCAQGRIASPDDASAYLSEVAGLAHACRTWGVALRLYAMVGLPGQTADNCRSTALYSQAIRPASLSVKAFEHYPGLRGQYGSLADRASLDEQWAPLLAAQQAIKRLPTPRSARARRGLWRLVYRAIDLVD